MSKKSVLYRSVWMIRGWPEEIEAAQLQATVRVADIVLSTFPQAHDRDGQGRAR